MVARREMQGGLEGLLAVHVSGRQPLFPSSCIHWITGHFDHVGWSSTGSKKDSEEMTDL